MSKETNIKIHGTLKVVMVYPGEDPLLRNHFKVRRVEKKVSWQNMEPQRFLISPRSFVKNHKDFVLSSINFVGFCIKLLWFFTWYIIRTCKVPWILIFVSFDISSHVEAFHIYGAILGVSKRTDFFWNVE